jgi:hypothetical protein
MWIAVDRVRVSDTKECGQLCIVIASLSRLPPVALDLSLCTYMQTGRSTSAFALFADWRTSVLQRKSCGGTHVTKTIVLQSARLRRYTDLVFSDFIFPPEPVNQTPNLHPFRRNGLGVKSKSQPQSEFSMLKEFGSVKSYNLVEQPQKHHKPAAALDTTTTLSARMIS